MRYALALAAGLASLAIGCPQSGPTPPAPVAAPAPRPPGFDEPLPGEMNVREASADFKEGVRAQGGMAMAGGTPLPMLVSELAYGPGRVEIIGGQLNRRSRDFDHFSWPGPPTGNQGELRGVLTGPGTARVWLRYRKTSAKTTIPCCIAALKSQSPTNAAKASRA